jgi:hypothetical protein
LVIPDCHMSHESFVLVDLAKQGSMLSVNTFVHTIQQDQLLAVAVDVTNTRVQ